METMRKRMAALALPMLLAATAATAQTHYRFVATDYVSTDENRAPQSAFTYDEDANTLSIKASGTYNIAFQMSSATSGKYYINQDETYFIVAGTNIKSSVSAAQMWWINGINIGGASATSVYKEDDTTILVWNINSGSQASAFDSSQEKITLSAESWAMMLALGATATSARKAAVITNINYYSAYELAAHYPSLVTTLGFTEDSLTTIYNSLLQKKIEEAQAALTTAKVETTAKTDLETEVSTAQALLASMTTGDYTKACAECDALEEKIAEFNTYNHTTSYSAIANGLLAQYDDLKVRLTFINDSIIRVSKYYGDSYEKSSWAVLASAQTDVETSVSENDGTVSLSSSKMRIDYQLITGIVSIYDIEGTELTGEMSFSMTDFQDGPNASYSISQNFNLDSDEHIYGLGQIQNTVFDQSNSSVYLRQANGHVCMPIYTSSKNYTLYWDNYSPTQFSAGAGTVTFESTGTGIDYYVLSGSNSDALLRSLRNLTGEAKMPALWNFGFYQSKERYQSANEVMEVMRKYREAGVPIDCVVQDWQYWGTDNNYWNAMAFNNPRYSNYAEMIDSIHNMNGKLMVSIWPTFGTKTDQYQYLNSLGRMITATAYPTDVESHAYDAYDSGARDYYWSKLYEGLASKGIDAYWLDATEPDYYTDDSDPQAATDYNYVTGTGETWRALRNVYPLASVEGVYDHHRAQSELSDKRVSIMTRSSYLGMQRTGAFMWSGDITASWDVFSWQIPAACGLSASGIPYWNSDTGGFFTGDYGDGVNNPEWCRLFVRWAQFSCFSPMMRFHGTNTPREIWQFGEPGDSTGNYDILEKYINLRYSLVPYLYSQAHQVVASGESFMYGLPLAFQSDGGCTDIKDEYMFGRSFLVAPVVKDQAESRDIYLPAGTQWTDFWTGEQTEGGQTISRETPMSIIPLYVKAGSILPWGPKVQYTSEKPWDDLEIRIYTGADGTFTLYEDEGDNYNYENGAYTEINFTWNDADSTLTISDRTGSFDGMLSNRTFNFVLVNADKGAGDAHTATFDKSAVYDGTTQTICFGSNTEGIREIKNSATASKGIYDLNGRKLSKAQGGVNIVNDNGSARKVIVR